MINRMCCIGLKEPGIFRETGSLETVRGYKEILDNGGSVDLTKEKDPHVVSTLLKLFLRSLPEPICTFELYSQFLEAGGNLTSYTKFYLILAPLIIHKHSSIARTQATSGEVEEISE